jgi:hypothetical protein
VEQGLAGGADAQPVLAPALGPCEEQLLAW